MNGKKLVALRRALELEPAWFAALLGLSTEKLRCWETSEAFTPSQLQTHILAILDVQTALLGDLMPELGRRILHSLLVSGVPYALLVLLQVHFMGHTVELPPSQAPDTEPPV